MTRILTVLATLSLLVMGFTADDNIYMIGQRPFESPHKIVMGPDLDNLLYMFTQQRPDGTIWSGVETFKRPSDGPVAEGYGAYPLRLWGSNFLVEENGVLVVPEIVTSKIVLQQPKHVDGKGITWDSTNLDTYITLDGPDLIVYVDGRERARIHVDGQ